MKNTEEEFIKLVRQSERTIFKVCSFYASCRAPVEDLYQEVVINLWRAWPRFRGESAFSTWMYRVALNTCISYVRKEKRHVGNVSLSELPDQPHDFGKEEKLAELYRLIGALSGLDKAIILLYLEGQDNVKIAEITGLTPGNIAVRLSRIRNKMKTNV